MRKRDVLRAAVAGAAASFSAKAFAQNGPKTSKGPILLTVSGRIGTGNRGPLDPTLDQLMVKQKVSSFDRAQAFDFATLSALPAITIKPTLEYDRKQHALKGPLLMDVMSASGVKADERTWMLVRAIDGYAVRISATEAVERRFIVATHLDGRPMALGGLGPLWTLYEPDRFPDMTSKPLPERFSLCPWATYHIEAKDS